MRKGRKQEKYERIVYTDGYVMLVGVYENTLEFAQNLTILKYISHHFIFQEFIQ